MIRQLFKVERGTIVHFLKWGVALLAFIAGLWLALTLFGNPGVARTSSGPMAGRLSHGNVPVPAEYSSLSHSTRQDFRRLDIA